MTSPSDYNTFELANSPSTGTDSVAGGSEQARAAQPQDWWARLGRIHVELLTPLVAQLFEKLDDTLFDRSASSYLHFFEGMRILRKNHDTLTKNWYARIEEAWTNLRPQMPGAFRPRLVSNDMSFAPDGELSLIDDATLERRLAIDSAIARGAQLCRMELPPLCHRLTVLRKGTPVPTDEVPASPGMLVRTFAQCLDEVPGLPVEAALIALKLFDRVVLTAVEHVCVELNRSLAQGGVAPQWTWASAFQQQRAARRGSAAGAAASVAPPDAHEYDRSWLDTVPAIDAQTMAPQFDLAALDNLDAGLVDGRPLSASEQANLSATVRGLLERRRISRFLASATGHGPANVVGGAESFNVGTSAIDAAVAAPAVLQLQTLIEALASLPQPELPTSWVGGVQEELDPALLKHELNRLLRQRTPAAPATKSAAHKPTVDAAQPEATEVPLGEYEDVIDMVAMMFSFVQQDHALPAGVQALLSRLQLPYLRLALVDPDMFSDVNHPARALMDRLAEVGKTCTPDNPMLAEAMLKMHGLVRRIVANHDASRAFFEREWTHFRTWADKAAERAAAREREQLAAVQSRLSAADEAAATANAATTEAKVDETVVDEPVIETVADVPAVAHVADAPTEQPVGDERATATVKPSPVASPVAASSTTAAAAPKYKIKPVLAKRTPARWTVGDWIEFKAEPGADASADKVGRGKVSWIGAFTGRTILVKPDGSMWREESRADLDSLLDRDVAFIVPSTSLFDRSLQSMFSKLRESVTAALS
jgi:hypothetical protein